MKEQDIIKGVCKFCAGAFDVNEELNQIGENLIDDYDNHPNVGEKIAEDGHKVITL